MASQVFFLALLAVSAFGYDLNTRLVGQTYPQQSYGLYNQLPVRSWQVQVPYSYPTNYLQQKQAYYLPYLAQKLAYIPASVRSQYLQHLEVPAVQGQYNQQQLPSVQGQYVHQQQLPSVQGQYVQQQQLPSVQGQYVQQQQLPFVQGQYIQQQQVPSVQGQYVQQQQQQVPTVRGQYVQQEGVREGVEGQVYSPLLNQILQNREQVPLINKKVIVNHDKQEKVHLKKDKSTVVQVPTNNQVRQEEQEPIVNYRRFVDDREIQLNQENTYPYQVRDVNQRVNLPVQEGLVRSYPEVSRQVPSLVQGYPENYVRYSDVVAPRYQSVYQPVSQAYPVRQEVLSQYLRPSKPVIQVTLDTVRAFPAQQVREEILQNDQPAYYGNDEDSIIENNLLF